jgi:hypothetical protein
MELVNTKSERREIGVLTLGHCHMKQHQYRTETAYGSLQRAYVCFKVATLNVGRCWTAGPSLLQQQTGRFVAEPIVIHIIRLDNGGPWVNRPTQMCDKPPGTKAPSPIADWQWLHQCVCVKLLSS